MTFIRRYTTRLTRAPPGPTARRRRTRCSARRQPCCRAGRSNRYSRRWPPAARVTASCRSKTPSRAPCRTSTSSCCRTTFASSARRSPISTTCSSVRPRCAARTCAACSRTRSRWRSAASSSARNRNVQAVPVFDTAGAVEIVMREDDGFTAAIASRRAATLYKGEVIAEHLQDHAGELDALSAAWAGAGGAGNARGDQDARRLRPAARAGSARPRAARNCAAATSISPRSRAARSPASRSSTGSSSSSRSWRRVRRSTTRSTEMRHDTPWLRVLGAYRT